MRASTIAKISTTMAAMVTAAGRSSALLSTIMAAAMRAATALIASERSGGGGASTNRVSVRRSLLASLTDAPYSYSWIGGEGGIRTHGTVSRSGAFKAPALVHYATSPGTACEACECPEHPDPNRRKPQPMARCGA